MIVQLLASQVNVASLSCLNEYWRSEQRWRHTTKIRTRYGYREFVDKGVRFRQGRLLCAMCWIGTDRPSILFDHACVWLVKHKMLLLGVMTLKRDGTNMNGFFDDISTLSTEVGYCSINKMGSPNEDRYRLLGGGFIVPDKRQTAFYSAQRGELYAVMDGVGSASHGMAAAQYIADQLPVFFTQTQNIPVDIDVLVKHLAHINQEIFTWGLMEGTQRPCGASTATILWLSPSQQAYLCHAGDSVAFLLRNQQLSKISHDHAYADGLFCYVGQGEGFSPQIHHSSLEDGDTWCLVTDGVTKGLNSHQIQQILQKYAGRADLAAKHLVDAAKRKGVQDDITALVIEI
jgi:serine/threonine protein phosphatase PrpC